MKKVGIGLGVICVIFVSVMGMLFKNEIQTISTVKKVDEYGFYVMNYKGDYGFDDFLKEGAKNDQELVQFVSKKLLKGIPIKIEIPALGCSTFAIDSPEGDRLFGRNFDLDYSNSALVITKPKKGYKSMSLVNLSFLGYQKGEMDHVTKRILSLAAPFIPMDGMNEKGVSIAILQIPGKPTNQKSNKIDITSSTAIRMVLDKAASVEEAVTLFKKYDLHDSAGSNYHYHIADKNGKSVLIEYVDNKINVIYPEQQKDYQVVTNFFQCEGPVCNKGDGQDRYEKIKQKLEGTKNGLTEEESLKLLSEVKLTDSYDENIDLMYNTQWSAVYNNTKQTAKVSVGQNYKDVYEFDLHDY